MAEVDEEAHRSVMRREGLRQTRPGFGQGHDRVASMRQEGDLTTVEVETDFTITGRLARSGRGDQSRTCRRLLRDFSDCLQEAIESAEPGPSTRAAGAERERAARPRSAAGRGPSVACPSFFERCSIASSASSSEAEPAARLLDADELGAWRGMLRAHSALTKLLDAELVREHGLPLSSYEVLLFLADSPRGQMRMSELADGVLLSRSGLTRRVDRMERDGLLCRERSRTMPAAGSR